MSNQTYKFLDSGDLLRLEKFQGVTLVRPCYQAVWEKTSPKLWKDVSATFTREKKEGWSVCKSLPKSWNISLDGVTLKLMPTDFGHLGIFPEHRSQFSFFKEQLQKRPKARVLNLFAYTGLASLFLAKQKAQVTHLDASKKSVAWAKENAELSGLKDAPIRYIVDDVSKFLKREIRRGSKYDAIILDPPTFGRGTKNELFVIEKDLVQLLKLCKEVLSDKPLFILLTCHTPGFTPTVLQNTLCQVLGRSLTYESGEMLLECESGPPLSSGSFVRGKYD